MASLFITEFSSVQQFAGVNLQVAQEPPVADSAVTVGATSSTPYPLQANTSLVRLQADVVCSIVVGKTPVAAATNRRLVAGVEYWLGIPPGAGLKIAVIQNS